MAKSAILQRISLSEAEALVEKEKRGERGENDWVEVEKVDAHPTVVNPNGGILYNDDGVIFAGEGMGEDVASALYLMNPRAPYNTSGESNVLLKTISTHSPIPPPLPLRGPPFTTR